MEQQNNIARTNMLERQIQTWGIGDEALLDLLDNTSRELFVPPKYRSFAFADTALPLPNSQRMLTPKEEAKVMQLLNPGPDDTVLQVGAGAGYLTALLAKCSPHVYTVDIDPNATQQVAKRLASLNIDNVTMVTGNAIQGWHAQSNYDVILVNGSVPFIPKALCHNLATNGRLFAVVGDAPDMQGTLVTRTEESTWEVETAFTTDQPRIANPLPEKSFKF